MDQQIALSEAPPGFAEGFFDTLSASIQRKAYREIWRNRGRPLTEIMDKIERKLTLAEQHEAETKLRAFLAR